jgi:hypothetical protein
MRARCHGDPEDNVASPIRWSKTGVRNCRARLHFNASKHNLRVVVVGRPNGPVVVPEHCDVSSRSLGKSHPNHTELLDAVGPVVGPVAIQISESIEELLIAVS